MSIDSLIDIWVLVEMITDILRLEIVSSEYLGLHLLATEIMPYIIMPQTCYTKSG